MNAISYGLYKTNERYLIWIRQNNDELKLRYRICSKLLHDYNIIMMISTARLAPTHWHNYSRQFLLQVSGTGERELSGLGSPSRRPGGHHRTRFVGALRDKVQLKFEQ